MSLAIHLLGKPQLERDGHAVAAPRGHKAWGLIAYLVLSRVRNPSREHLAELLFAGADDPLGSLRWNLAELRRALGAATLPHGSTELSLAPGTFVDVDALVRATPQEAVAIPGLGRELLEGMDFGSTPAFETWLLIERRRLLGASEAALHEAALDRLAAGEATAAVRLAARLVEMNPYDENFQELLVRSYSEAGDREAANRQVSACLELFRAERGTAPGPAVFRAAEARPPAPLPAAGPSGLQAARARLKAGDSAISAGSFEPGVRSLARAAAEAKACGDAVLEAECWLALGTALVHSARGRDEEGADALLRASALAEEHGLGDVAAAAYRELGYVDILRARYARCAQRLERATTLAESDDERAGVEAMLGLAAADTGAHERALVHLRRSVELAERAGSHQQAAFSLSFVVAPTSCAKRSTRPGPLSSARSPSPARRGGSPSSRGRNRGSPRPTWPPACCPRAASASSTPGPWPPSSAIRAGRGPRARASGGWHARKAGSPPGCACSRKHGGALRASPTPTSGSRRTPWPSWPSRRSKQDIAAHASGSRTSVR
jgi:DNA-binding SARP family transcriptional activator